MIRRLAASLAILSLLVSTAAVAPAATLAACDPFTTQPIRDQAVRTSTDVIGFALGSQEVSAEQSNTYLEAVDADSDRVVHDVAAVSVGGRPIDYAIVGTPARVTAAGLDQIHESLRVLRDPLASHEAVQAALTATPAVLWLSANVHGNEESGADAALHVLYELASRSDCVVANILAEAIVVILPIQNPDGREEATRRNLYGFDMNRDWFARTQPETDGKLDVIRQYPPMLYIDAHEFGLPNYFFPPNADPEYAEIPDTAHDWINELYSPAISAQFDKEKIKYFHGAPYDFFAVVFGDTVPTTGYHAAGMTFEKESSDAISVREHEHFTSMWASIAAGAAARSRVLEGWHASYVEAYQEGVAGALEPNAVFEPRHDLYQEVPDVTVRHYFLRDDPDRRAELQLLVRRLQRMDVTVNQLSQPLSLAAYHPYGDPSEQTTLPVGTYWISLAQGQKHWIQAMLHEDSWIPFEVTYDVTAWSNPLLMNLDGGWTGEDVAPIGTAVALQAPPPPPTLPAATPSIGLFEIPNSSRGFEAAGQTRYLFDKVWGLANGTDYRDVTAADITAGLAGIDVLIIPDGYANYGVQALGAKGKRALRDWVNGGGRLVAWQGGVEVAVKAGVSTVKLAGSHTDAPGTLIRVSLDGSSPLAAGIGDRDWVMYQDDRTMKPGLGSSVATFPASGQPDYATSGLTIGVDGLAGTSALVDEGIGAGRAVLFSVDPNFRGWTQGTQRLLWNAIFGGDPAGAGLAPAAGSRQRAAAEKAAADAVATVPDLGSAIRIRVASGDAAATAKVLQRRSREAVRVDLGAETLFLVANRADLSAEEDPSFALVLGDLDKAGIDLRAASHP
ncbi:MAG: M14 family zinc carboxypeptidase [Chloroflexota bacterium]